MPVWRPAMPTDPGGTWVRGEERRGVAIRPDDRDELADGLRVKTS